MAWIIENSVLNPEVVILPSLAHYKEGSIVVLNAPYGKIEYEVIGGRWIPTRALTDIEIYVSSDGSDEIGNRGTSDLPFFSLQYILDRLPKKIKNLNIRIIDSEYDFENGSCNANGFFEDFVRTDPTDKITITGNTSPRQEVAMMCANTVNIFNDALVEIVFGEGMEYSLFSTLVDGPISGIGTEDGFQYVDIADTDAIAIGILGLMGVMNTSTGEISYVCKTKVIGSDSRIYLSSAIFSEVGQGISIHDKTENSIHILCTNSGELGKIMTTWPVVSVSPMSIVVPNSCGYIPETSDRFQSVRFTPGGFEFISCDIDVQIIKMDSSIGLSSIDHCPGIITYSYSHLGSIDVYDSPFVIFHKTRVSGDVRMMNSFSSKTIDLFEHQMPDIFQLLYLSETETVDTGIPDSGILSISSMFDYFWVYFLEKSALSLKWSILQGTNIESGDNITLVDSYLQFDGTSIITDIRPTMAESDVYAIGVYENSSINNRRSDPVQFINVTNEFNMQTRSGIYKETAFKSYGDRDEMLSDINVPNGVIGNVLTEPGNIYLRQSLSVNTSGDVVYLAGPGWMVLSGNKYETENLPTTTQFIIPPGTIVWDITTSEYVYE